MKRLIAGMVSVALAGCATPPGYVEYAAAIKAMAAQQAASSMAASEAIAKIAASGDSAARVAAVLMLGLQAQRTQAPVMEPPRDQALQWAAVIMPSLTAVASGYFGYRLGVTQSNNQAQTTLASYDAIAGTSVAGYNALTTFRPVPVDFAGLIKSLPPTQTVTIGGDGVVGNGTVSKPVSCVGGTTTNGSGGDIGC